MLTTHWNWYSVKAWNVTIKYTDLPVEGNHVYGWDLSDFAGSAMDINVFYKPKVLLFFFFSVKKISFCTKLMAGQITSSLNIGIQ